MPPKERNKSAGVKAMTPQEERELDEALGMAARVATKNARDLMIPNSPGAVSDGKISDEDRSPRSRSVFSFTNKFRRQSSKDKSSLDSIQSPSTGNLVDDATVEAQEAYNVLVANGKGKGMKHSNTNPESLGGGGGERKELRTKRYVLPQRPATALGDTGSMRLQSRPVALPSNSHIRRPQDIPGRESEQAVVATATVSTPDDDDDSPFRKLRANRGAPLFARGQRGISTTASDDVWSLQSPGTASAGARVGDYDDVPLPLPPRKPATFSMGLNHKPRERKYPLLMDGTSMTSALRDLHQINTQDYANTAVNRLSFASDYDVPNSRHVTRGQMTARPMSAAVGNVRTADMESAAKTGSRAGPLRAFPLTAGGMVERISKRTAVEPVDYYDSADGQASIGDASSFLFDDNSSYEDALECVLENPDLNSARFVT